MTSALHAPTGLSITTPGDWIVLDVDALAEEPSVSALVDARINDVPELEPLRDEIVQIVAGTMREARDQGLIFAAVLAHADNTGAPILASVAVAVVPRADDAPAGSSPGASGASSSDPAGTLSVEDGSVQEHEEGAVDLPAGQAVRIERVQRRPLEAGGPDVLCYALEYLIPVPGEEATAVIGFASPMLGERDLLAPLFQEIAESFAFTWDDSPSAANGR